MGDAPTSQKGPSAVPRERRHKGTERRAKQSTAAWEEAEARVVLLRADLDLIPTVASPPPDPKEPPGIHPEARHQIDLMLKNAKDAVDEARSNGWGRPSRIAGWWNGAAIERAWRDIHDVEILMARWRPLSDLDSGRAGVKSLAHTALPPGDPQRAAIDSEFDDAHWPPEDAVAARAQYGAALRSVYEASDNQYARLRSFRNIILLTALMLLLLAGAITLLSTWKPSALPVCSGPATSGEKVCPTGKRQPSYLDVPLVELLGMVGAAIAAAFSLRTIRGTSTPYAVPVALALLKVPAGALTAVIGLLFLSANFVPGFSALDSQNQVLAYAVVFGYAQQLITRLVDRQGQSLLDATAPSDKSATAPTPTQ